MLPSFASGVIVYLCFLFDMFAGKTGLNIEMEVFNRSMRRTTKMASAQTMQKRREREQEDTKRRIKKEERDQFREAERELTQEELMKEALKTEEINKASYLELVRLEEEKKRCVRAELS